MAERQLVPKARVTLTYDTRQPDQPRKERELPLRLLVIGDLTGRAHRAELPGAAVPAGDLDARPIHDLNGRNLDAVMARLDISVELRGVQNHVDRSGTPFDVTLPIRSMASFEPGQIVKHVPATQRLLRIRRLLLELQAHVDNNKQFRRLVRELTSPARAGLLEELRKACDAQCGAQLRVPTAAELAEQPDAAADAPAGQPPPPAAPAPPVAAPAVTTP